MEQATRVGEFCKRNALIPDLILCSPILRARQTADGFVRAAGTEPPLISPFLACGMTPAAALAELKALHLLETVMLIGHEPDFSSLAAQLLDPESRVCIHIRKASLTLLDLHQIKPGAATLEFSIPCRLM
jgi:phosphohistidine phosphatase